METVSQIIERIRQVSGPEKADFVYIVAKFAAGVRVLDDGSEKSKTVINDITNLFRRACLKAYPFPQHEMDELLNLVMVILTQAEQLADLIEAEPPTSSKH